MISKTNRFASTFALILLASQLTYAGGANQLLINEIYFDPPGSTGDNRSEYIELRGTPEMSLDNHYLIFLENESSITANAGLIEAIFDLNGQSLGTNGYLTIRQAGNFYADPAPGTTDIVNSGSRFGRGALSPSTIGFSDIGDDGKLENSGFTAMLVDISSGVAPALEQDLDTGDDGMFNEALPEGWNILDSIGVISEFSEISGRLYGKVNFSANTPDASPPNIEPDAVGVNVGFEIEYIGRWGDSTGSEASDWHASNLTLEIPSGFTGAPDYRQAGEPHAVTPVFPPGQFVETSQGVPYGEALLETLGAPNFYALDGDFEYVREEDRDGEFDGDVDGIDFLIWQRNVGLGDGNDGTREYGDANMDREINIDDLTIWQNNYGMPLSTGPLSASTAVPEAASLTLFISGTMLLSLRQRRCH